MVRLGQALAVAAIGCAASGLACAQDAKPRRFELTAYGAYRVGGEFEDENGETRTLTRQEVLVYTAVLAGAGNETTGRLIGWLAKLLAEHPDQRRMVVEDRSLIPNVIDEALRFEPTGHAVARYVMKDVEYHGRTIPEGSPILLLMASANRDPRRYEDPDVFDATHAFMRRAPSMCRRSPFRRATSARRVIVSSGWIVPPAKLCVFSTSTSDVRGWCTSGVRIAASTQAGSRTPRRPRSVRGWRPPSRERPPVSQR